MAARRWGDLVAARSTTGSRRKPVSGSSEALADAVADGVAEFGKMVGPRLRRGVGSPEDALRDAVVRLFTRVGRALEMPVVAHGETPIRALSVRLDYLVDVAGSEIGAIELKAPGKGVPNHWRPRRHDREQWEKLKLLPNVIYTDGTKWALYRWGEQSGPVAEVEGDLSRAGSGLKPKDSRLAGILYDFLTWQPSPPSNLSQLIRNSARLCRLLKDEVIQSLQEERAGTDGMFAGHMEDWRRLLFPSLTDDQFADGYAQSVTFGLLLARRSGIDFAGLSIAEIGGRLSKTHLLVGRALSILTDQPGRKLGVEDQSIAVRTMRRVIEVSDWSDWKDSSDQLYEQFLELYDPDLRQESGSYYTPPPVADFVVRFVDSILSERMNRRQGIASRDVVIVDPAMGSGTFLLSTLHQVAQNTALDGGDEPAELRALLSRLIGFERQIAPFAVAELKLHQLLAAHGVEVNDEKVRLYVTDTLDDPNVEALSSPVYYEPIAESRRAANRVKSEERVMVVLGNPPYREQAKKLAGLILARNPGRKSLLDSFRTSGSGRLDIKLHNLNVYFWRWACWKVFEAHPREPEGIVAFLSTSAFTTGPGFGGMREYLRRQADWGWIIDLTPEGHQPDVSTRLFPGVQQPLCIGIFGRAGDVRRDQAAEVRYLSLRGHRHDKLARLAELTPSDGEWLDCPDEWSSPFRPKPTSDWRSYPSLKDVIPWSSPGVKPNRTWVYAPERATLGARWQRLLLANEDDRASLMKETRDRKVHMSLSAGFDNLGKARALATEQPKAPTILSVSFRSFDRQFVIGDRRVVDFPRQDLWLTYGPRQVFATTLMSDPITKGPAIVFTADVPDMHHYMGDHGGRVLPLFRDREALHANLAPGLLELLGQRLDLEIAPEDVFAYLASVASHSGYVDAFRDELRTPPGCRIPLTISKDAWRYAVDLGRRVIWLHTYGRRFVDPKKGRPDGPPREFLPKVVKPIPSTPSSMPEAIRFSQSDRLLHVGSGAIGPVSPEVWNYHVSSMHVLQKWFDYRKREPRTRYSSALNNIVADRWTAETTEALRDLVAVLQGCIALEAQQRRLLEVICEGPLLDQLSLEELGVLPAPSASSGPIIDDGSTLF